MGLTVTEKEHFKNRLRSRVKERMAAVRGDNPKWERDLRQQAVELTAQRFDVEKDLATLEKYHNQVDALNDKIATLERAVCTKITGLKSTDIDADGPSRPAYYRNRYGVQREDSPNDDIMDGIGQYARYPRGIQDAVKAQVKHEFLRLRDLHPIGRRINELRTQRQEFEDRITACANHRALQELWAEACAAVEMPVDDGGRQPRGVHTDRTAQQTTS